MKLTPGPPPYLCRQQTLVTVISHKLKATLWRRDQNIDFYFILLWRDSPETILITQQGGRTWQPFVGSKIGNENIRQARIYNFRVKCVVFAHNRKFAKLTQ